MKTKELSEQLRNKIVEGHKSGDGYKIISETLNIPLSTVRSVIKKWKVHHTTETLPRPGRPSKLNSQARRKLVLDVTVKPTVTLKELQKFMAETGKNVSKSTISRALHKAGLTRRSDKEAVSGKNPPENLHGVSNKAFKLQHSVKKKELSEQVRDKVVERHKCGEGYKKISSTLNIPLGTVRSIIKKWKVYHTTQTLPRSGRPPKLSSKARRKLVHDVTAKPAVSLKEVQKSIAETDKNVCKPPSQTLLNAGLTRSDKEAISEKNPSEFLHGISNKAHKQHHPVRRMKELSEQMREKVVERHKLGEGYKNISKSLSIPLSTVRSIIKKWKVYHTTQTLPRSGRPPKLSSKARRKLIQDVTVKPTITLKELQKTIAESGKNVSRSTISRVLHNAGMIWRSEKEALTGTNLSQNLQALSN